MSTLLQPTSAGQPQVDRPTVERPEVAGRWSAWAVFLLWTVATCAAGFLLAALSTLVDRPNQTAGTSDTPSLVLMTITFAIPFGAVIGAVVGQLVVLRRCLGSIDRVEWLIFGGLTWMASGALIFVAHGLWIFGYTIQGEFQTPPELERAANGGWDAVAGYAQPALFLGLVAGALGGLFIGLAQNSMLRKHVSGLRWVSANVAAFGLGGAAGTYIFALLDVTRRGGGRTDILFQNPALALPTPVSLLIVATITGAVLAWRLRNSPENSGRAYSER